MERFVNETCDEYIKCFCEEIAEKYQINFYELYSLHKWNEFSEFIIKKINNEVWIVSDSGEKIAKINKEWDVVI